MTSEEMAEKGMRQAVILEKDTTVARSLSGQLEDMGYTVTPCPSKAVLLDRLKANPNQLAVLGEEDTGSSPFEILEGVVKASPMTSIVLLTDLPHDEVHERAEGYGILGRIGTSIPRDELARLVERFEAISEALSMTKGGPGA
jgi:DNA-binding NtrC family response regulator